MTVASSMPARQLRIARVFEAPASAAAVDELAERARRRLRMTLTSGYQDFLRESDGLDYNGHVIYACRQVDDAHRSLPGFIEINEVLRKGPFPEQIAFGETGDDLFVQDQTSGGFAIVDRASASVHEEFSTFDTMLERVLTLAIDS